jgi:hypothetical protein
MSEEDKIRATALANSKQKSLELLFDYTKFHIGIYLTLTASYLAVATANVGGKRLLELNSFFVWVAVIAFMIAGLAGGTIISSITQYVKGGSSVDFLDDSDKIGPWDCKKLYFLTARKWTHIEHTSFWVGLLSAVFSFIGAR